MTLLPGQSVEVRVDHTDNCGDEGEPCRRVVVPAAGGAAVEVELTALEDQRLIGLTPTRNFYVIRDHQTRVMTSTGEVWVVGEPGRVRPTAR